MSPEAGRIFVGEGGKLIVGTRSAATKIAGEASEFFLGGSVLGSLRVESRRGSLRAAASGASSGLGTRGVRSFLVGLRDNGQREKEGENSQGKTGEGPELVASGSAARFGVVACGSNAQAGMPVPQKSFAGVSGTCSRWRRDSRRERKSRPPQGFPPSSDRSNPPGGP